IRSEGEASAGHEDGERLLETVEIERRPGIAVGQVESAGALERGKVRIRFGRGGRHRDSVLFPGDISMLRWREDAQRMDENAARAVAGHRGAGARTGFP